MTDRSGIYKITNETNGKVYIGSATNLRLRENCHFSELIRNIHANKYLQNAFNKYGKDEFTIQTLEFINFPTKENLILREQYWIDLYNSSNRIYGYNLRAIADSNKGTKFSEEARKNIGKAQIGKIVSAATKELLLRYASQPKSEEIKTKISKSLKGKIYTAERCSNMSKGKMDRKFKIMEPPMLLSDYEKREAEKGLG